MERVTLSLDVSWAAFTDHTDEFGLSLLGTEGGASIHSKDYSQEGTLRLIGEIDGTPTVTIPRLIPNYGHTETIKNFVAAILDGVPIDSTGKSALELARLIRLIYRSAELGRELRIPEDLDA